MNQTDAPPQVRAHEEVPHDFSDFLNSFGAAAKKAAEAERKYVELFISDRIARAGSSIAIIILVLFLALVGLLLAVFAGAKAWGDALQNEALSYLGNKRYGVRFAHLLGYDQRPTETMCEAPLDQYSLRP